MKKLIWIYGALALVAAIFLSASFFMQDVRPLTQIALLIQSVGYGWVCGLGIGSNN